MSSIRTRALKVLSAFLVLGMVLNCFGGMAFAVMVADGAAATATSNGISVFNYSGNNSKTIIISDGNGNDANITLDQNLTDVQGIVGALNARLAGTDITAVVNSTGTFKLTSSVIGKNSLITISGLNATDFFAQSQYRGIATNLESVEETKASLTPFYDSDDSIGWVTGKMILPKSDGINGTSISWSSNNQDVISNIGVVIRQANDTIVTLTATITKGATASDTQKFVITVIGTEPKIILTPEESVANTKAGLTPYYSTDESQGYVKGEISLPLTDVINGTSISWTSSNSSLINVIIGSPSMNKGEVTRPALTASVTLTAMISKGIINEIVTFDVSVIGTDSEAVLMEKAALNPTYASGDSESSVTKNLILLTASKGVTIAWSSSNDTYLANDGTGTVKRPGFVDGPALVVLTATLTMGGATATKIFNITILPKDPTDLEAVQYDKNHIAVGYAAGDSASSVTNNLTLDTDGVHGSVVTWSSSNPTVVSNSGIVTRQIGTDTAVTLTATVTKGTAEDTATFALTVKGKQSVPIGNTDSTTQTPVFEMSSATKSLIDSLGSNVLIATVETSTNSAGDIITRVKQAELLQKIANTGAKAIIVPAASANGKFVVSLTPGLLTEMKRIDQQSKIVFQSNGVSYEVPAALADTSAIAKAFGLSYSVAKDAELQITIHTVPAGRVQDQITNAGGNIVSSVVSFSIAIITPDKTYDFDDFRGMNINRSFELNKSVDSAASVGVIINSDGTVTPVPTIFTTVQGQPVAVVKVDHNSTYTIIEHTSVLSDIGISWAKDKIKILANKMIINGYEDGTFKPNGDVTRAEFVHMLATGLGINADSDAAMFSDVRKEAWYAGALGAMVSRGFISGYVDGSFKAEQRITREEEVVVLSRVLTYLNKDVKPGQTVLDRFRDRSSVSEYAVDSVSMLVDLEMMNGNDQGDLNPQGFATRAETATLIFNLLSFVKLVN